MPICNLRYRCHLLCNPWSRGNNYKQHMPLALRLGILHRRRSPQSRRLLRLKGYIMEHHSTPDPMNRGNRTQRRISTPSDPQGSVICTCPARPKRVCNVKGCKTAVSRYNPFPFCNSCRINPLCNVKMPSGIPRDMEGAAPTSVGKQISCPIHCYNYNRI